MKLEMIEVVGLHLAYDLGRGRQVVAIEELSFHVHSGESLAVIGPSGCGKSSLLYVIAGLIPPTAGAVYLDGEEVRGPRRGVALVLQDLGLLPWKTVWKNVTLGLEVDGSLDEGRRAKVRQVLDELGLLELRDRYPAQLSGGQQQRVALARALALEPQVLLMDEPLGSLDALTKEIIQNTILQLWRERAERLSLILVTHDIEEAVFLGQRVLVLTPRPARLKAEILNPGMGTVEYRASPEFYEQVRRLRQLL